VINMVLRRGIPLAAIAVIAAFGLVASAATAQPSAQRSGVPNYAVTPKRAMASTAAVVGLISAVIGGSALVRSIRRIGNRGRNGAIVALVLGPISLVLGGAVLATAEGGVGTGNGVAGAVIAVVLALAGTALSGLALARSRRPG
jgi:hypothetical protein